MKRRTTCPQPFRGATWVLIFLRQCLLAGIALERSPQSLEEAQAPIPGLFLMHSPPYADRVDRWPQFSVARSPLAGQLKDCLPENLVAQPNSSKTTVNAIDRADRSDNPVARRPGEFNPVNQLNSENDAPLEDTAKIASAPRGDSTTIHLSSSRPPQPSHTTFPFALCTPSVRTISPVVTAEVIGGETRVDDSSRHNDVNARVNSGEEWVIGRTDSRAGIHETERKG